MPTRDNPMANYLMGDDPSYNVQAPWYPSMKQEVQQQWKDIHPFERKRDAERNFIESRFTTSAESTRFLNAQYEELKGILAGLGLAR